MTVDEAIDAITSGRVVIEVDGRDVGFLVARLMAGDPESEVVRLLADEVSVATPRNLTFDTSKGIGWPVTRSR